jgi:hypothetical protein
MLTAVPELYQNAAPAATRAGIGKLTSRADRQRSMSERITPLAAPDLPTAAATALDAPAIASGPAHCDTLALHFWRKPAGMLSAIRAINRREVFWERCKDAKRVTRGYNLIVQQPQIKTLCALDRWMLEHGGCISRFDITSELTPTDPTMTIEELKHWLSRHVILRWRPAGPSFEIDGNFYSVKQSAREDGRKSKRDYLLYDRKSKIDPTSGQIICEFELRFQRAEAARREDQILPSDLIRLDPQALIHKHIKFVDMDGYDLESHIAKITRRTLEHDREQHRQRSKTSPFRDRYRATLPKRIASLMCRIIDGKAQSFKDQCPKAARRLKSLRNVLLLPTSLTWPDQDGASIDITQLNSGNTSPYSIDMAPAAKP